MQNSVSVIVPFFNAKPYLEACVRSLLAQTIPSLEIILVDDGSADGSGLLADSLAAEDSRIRVLHQENRGVSTARNNGLDAANGAFIGFVDADDTAEPDMFQTLYAAAVENNCDIVTGCFSFFEGDKLVYTTEPPFPAGRVFGRQEIQQWLPAMHENQTFLYIWRRLFSAELIRSNGIRFDPQVSIGEDSLFCMDCFLAADRVIAVDKAVYHYNATPTGAMRNPRFKPHLLPSLQTVYARRKQVCRTYCPDREETCMRDMAQDVRGKMGLILGNLFREPTRLHFGAFRRLCRMEFVRDMLQHLDWTRESFRAPDSLMLRLAKRRLYLPAFCIASLLFRRKL